MKTPLLQGEHIRSLEPHVDLMVAKGTDFVRGDVIYDGITGTMKIAHAAEGLGLDIEYHGCGPATRHVMAATRTAITTRWSGSTRRFPQHERAALQ